MKIGIDAKWYFTGPVSTQTVLQNLLPRLFQLYPTHTWIIFLDKKDRNRNFPFRQPNITCRYVWADNNMLSNVFLLPRFARKENLDVMVFQTFPSFMTKTKAIAFIHDVLFRDYPQFFTWKERLYFLPLQVLAWHATRIIATTEYVANNLVKHHYTKEKSKIDIVPLAVDSVFRPIEKHDTNILELTREKYRLPERYLLFVGRLNVRKNIENLLKAILLLQPIPLPLVIVGKADWKMPNLQTLLSQPDLDGKIFIHSQMSNEELAATYAMATIFCFPSFAEGFGLPPVEAMASGVPVIVSNSTALTEVCGSAAVYIDPEEPHSIATAIRKLLQDHDFYKTKRTAGMRQAGRYSWDTSAAAFMASITEAFKKVKS